MFCQCYILFGIGTHGTYGNREETLDLVTLETPETRPDGETSRSEVSSLKTQFVNGKILK